MTSRMKIIPSLIAYCTFIRPPTLSASASSRGLPLQLGDGLVGESVCGGSEQALSPEWMPASSMCSMMPQTNTSLPSARQSTSISVALLTIAVEGIAEIVKLDMTIEDGKVAIYRARINVSFKYQEE